MLAGKECSCCACKLTLVCGCRAPGSKDEASEWHRALPHLPLQVQVLGWQVQTPPLCIPAEGWTDL